MEQSKGLCGKNCFCLNVANVLKGNCEILYVIKLNSFNELTENEQYLSVKRREHPKLSTEVFFLRIEHHSKSETVERRRLQISN
jgi:hypothetical protein